MGEGDSGKRGDGADQASGDLNPYAAPKETSAYDPVTASEPGEHWLATLKQRFIGALIDSSLLLAAMGIVYLGVQSIDTLDAVAKDWLVIFSPAPVELLQGFLIVKSGQSIGKRIARTRIVLLDGSLPGFVRGVLLRQWLWHPVSYIPVVGVWSGLETLLVFRRDRRTLHDWIAGTRVVRVRTSVLLKSSGSIGAVSSPPSNNRG